MGHAKGTPLCFSGSSPPSTPRYCLPKSWENEVLLLASSLSLLSHCKERGGGLTYPYWLPRSWKILILLVSYWV